MPRVLATCLTLLLAPTAVVAQGIVKETLTSNGRDRTYYLYVPEPAAKGPAPLIVTLHGSNRNGRILVDHWQRLARTEGIILAGPDATLRSEWNIVEDGPQFLYDLVEAIKSRHPVDPSRVYLFGHSAGAIHGMHNGVLESEYFAAVAAHAGVIMEDYAPFVERAPRKIPIAIWVGTNDRFFPVANVRATRDLLTSHGFPVELTEISSHTHDYYGRSSQINKAAWEFLGAHRLAGVPKYQKYDISK